MAWEKTEHGLQQRREEGIRIWAIITKGYNGEDKV